MASFKVQNSFSLYNRGLVLAGSVLDGEVFIGDFISFEYEGVCYQKSIVDIGIIDKFSEKEAQVGILLNYSDNEEMEFFSKMNLEEQVAKVSTGDISR